MALVVGGTTVKGATSLDASKLTGTAQAFNCSGHTNNNTPSGTWKIVGQGIWNGQAPQRTAVWFRIS